MPAIGIKASLYLLALSLLLSLVLTPSFTLPGKTLVEGEKAPRLIKAQRSYNIIDEEATAKIRDRSESAVRSVYDFDAKNIESINNKLFKSFERIKKEYFGKEQASISTDESFKAAKLSFENALGGIKIDDSVFSYLVKAKFNWKISWTVNRLINLVKNKYIIAQKSVLESDIDRGITIRNAEDKSENAFEELGSILDISEAKRRVTTGTSKIFKGYSPQRKKIIGKLAANLISPNLSYNKEETQLKKERAKVEIKPVVIQIKKNDVILRNEETIQKRHLIILKGIKKELTEQKPGLYIFFMTLFFFFFFQILGHFSLTNFSRFKPSQKDILVLGLLMFLTLVSSRVYLFMAWALVEKMTWLPPEVFIYFVPVAGMAMITRLLVGMEASLIFSFIMSVGLSLLFEKPLFYTIYALSSCLIGVNAVSDCRAHNDIYKAGIKVALISMVIVISIIVLSSLNIPTYQTIVIKIIFGVLAAFLSGIASSFLILALIPFCEYLFNYTTDVKLLELSNLNNPVLRDLMIRAPGSYHHSMMVGTLAENAAEAVGADALLARVGAYYHDIGKMKNPHYFIENQFGGYNIHDRQPPHLSKTMILSHVKEGVRMGIERRLGEPVVNIIQQHHGTTAMIYFYGKAKNEYEKLVKKGDEEVKQIDESDYRYEGPKPQTVEAAIVMMSDSVEAATRAMNTSHLPRLKVVCEKIVNRLFTDGQLDDCDLTLKDLHRIVDSFYHVLVGVYHRRISYPGGQGIKTETPYDANYNPKSAKEEEAATKKDSTVDEKDIFKKMGQ